MSAEQAVPVKGREQPAAVTPPTLPPPEGKLRLKPLDRQQVVRRAIDPDRLVAQDHPVRALWDGLERLDLSPFDEGMDAGRADPGATDPTPQGGSPSGCRPSVAGCGRRVTGMNGRRTHRAARGCWGWGASTTPPCRIW